MERAGLSNELKISAIALLNQKLWPKQIVQKFVSHPILSIKPILSDVSCPSSTLSFRYQRQQLTSIRNITDENNVLSSIAQWASYLRHHLSRLHFLLI